MINLKVLNVLPTDNYEVIVIYSNGEIKIYDIKPYLELGVFKYLKNKKIFNTVKPRFDTIEWPNVIPDKMYCSEIDIDPDTLYEESISYENYIIQIKNRES